MVVHQRDGLLSYGGFPMSQILVVDDNDACRNTLKTVLECRGYEVVCANDGQEALNYLRSGLRPSIILLDLEMPDMNGFEFRAIQREEEALRGIPVILVSGESYLSTIAD